MAKTSSSKSSSKSSAPKTSSTKGQTGFDKKGNRVSVNSSSAVSFGSVRGGASSTTRPTGPAPSSFSTAPAPVPTPAIGQPAAQPSSYQIQGGDTLGGIASRYGTSVQSLMAQNPSISNPNMIRAGSSLNIGPMGVPPKAQQTVSGDQMAGVNPYNVPGTPTPTLSSGLIADVATSTADASSMSTPEPVNPQQQTLDYIQQLTQQQGEKGDRTLEIQKKEKLDTKQRDLTAIDNKIKERTRALELKRRAIIESPYAGTKSGQQRDLDTLERQSAQELADLAIVKSVALEDYTTAYDIAQRKIDAEFEPLQQQIDNAIKFYQLNQDNLTAKEKVELSAKIQEQQAEADYGRQIKLIDYNAKIDAAQAATAYSRQVSLKAADEAATKADPSSAALQVEKAQAALNNARSLAYASGRGRSIFQKGLQAGKGSTHYTELEAYANTLRTNILTLATDPSIKKFFGPQMSNADVQLMTSAGTSLNPELMKPEAFEAELDALEALLNKLSGSAAAPTSGTTSGGNSFTITQS